MVGTVDGRTILCHQVPLHCVSVQLGWFMFLKQSIDVEFLMCLLLLFLVYMCVLIDCVCACMCRYQLVGAKKVQQQLANQGELEKFLSVEEGSVGCKQTFAGLWQVDDASVAMVLESGGEGYVMKPQREGGGNNIYGADIVQALDEMTTKEERLAFIFMEMITPPEIKGIMVKSGT